MGRNLKLKKKTSKLKEKLTVREDFSTPEVLSDVIKKACLMRSWKKWSGRGQHPKKTFTGKTIKVAGRKGSNRKSKMPSLIRGQKMDSSTSFLIDLSITKEAVNKESHG